MEFKFDKFVDDLERRELNNKKSREINREIANLDELRRKRSELYHEKWQNRIKWEK
jgi:hypothetical protein